MKNALKKEFAGIKYYQAALLLLLALVAIVIGSLKDFAISSAVYKPGNAFGKFAAYVGPLPAYALFGSTGVLFYINWKGEGNKDSKFLAIICALIFPILAGSLYGYECFDSLSNRYVAALIGVALVGVCDLLLYFLFRHADKDEAYQAGITFLFASAVVILLIYLLKKAGLRPRYYWLTTHDAAKNYRDWWNFDASVQEAFSSQVTYVQDDFQSWPSAHAAFGGMMVLSALFARLNPKLKGKESYFIYGSLIWCILISAGRLSDGSHFLSDVAFGAFFGVLFSMLVAYLVYLPAPEGEEDSLPEPAQKKKIIRGPKCHLAKKHVFVKNKHYPCKKAL